MDQSVERRAIVFYEVTYRDTATPTLGYNQKRNCEVSMKEITFETNKLL